MEDPTWLRLVIAIIAMLLGLVLMWQGEFSVLFCVLFVFGALIILHEIWKGIARVAAIGSYWLRPRAK